MLNSVETQLLPQVRNYLDITWRDAAQDNKLRGIISRGMVYIRGLVGKEQGEKIDFTKEGKAKELLLEYIRYTRSGALDEFATNYLPELLRLQIETEMTANATQQGENTDL